MQQIVAVASNTEWPKTWALDGHELRLIGQLGRDDLGPDVTAVVLVAQSPARTVAAAAAVEAARRDFSLALLLAGPPQLAWVEALLRQRQFDGFLDLRWPPELVGAVIANAVRNVQHGRSLVEIQHTILEQTRAETAQLYDQATHDELTRLFNHRHLSELMAREHERNKRGHHPYALVYIDLDNLKTLNSRFGHAGGSAALRTLAQVMTESLRASDVALRVGGDEFVVYLPDCDKRAGALYADRVRQRLQERKLVLAGDTVELTFSAGVASFPEDARQYSELLERADLALLEAKKLGKNQAAVFRSDVVLAEAHP